MFKTLFMMFLLISGTVCAQPGCPDDSLKVLGWDVHSSDKVKEMSEELIEMIGKNPENFSKTSIYKMFSTIANRWVELTSIDSLTTPSDEMLDDILWVRDLSSGEVLEVRWYDSGKAHSMYDPNVQSCATNLIPFAENSLY